jgi:hypothetical protein
MKKQIIFIVIILLIITLIPLFSVNSKNYVLKEDKYCLSSDYILGYPVWDGDINNPVSDYVELTLSNSWKKINNFEKYYKRIIDFKFLYENEIIILGEDRQSEILLIKYNIIDGSQEKYLLPNYINNSEDAFIKLYEINNNFYLFGLTDVDKNYYNGEIVIYLAYYDFINDKFIEIDMTELNESLDKNFYISNIVGDNDGNLFFIFDKNIYKIANNKNSIEVIELSENKKFDINFSQGKIIIYDDYLYILNKVINKNEISIREHKFNLMKINLSNYEIIEIGQVNFYDEANIHNLWFDQNNKHLWIDSNGWFDISENNSHELKLQRLKNEIVHDKEEIKSKYYDFSQIVYSNFEDLGYAVMPIKNYIANTYDEANERKLKLSERSMIREKGLEMSIFIKLFSSNYDLLISKIKDAHKNFSRPKPIRNLVNNSWYKKYNEKFEELPTLMISIFELDKEINKKQIEIERLKLLLK